MSKKYIKGYGLSNGPNRAVPERFHVGEEAAWAVEWKEIYNRRFPMEQAYYYCPLCGAAASNGSKSNFCRVCGADFRKDMDSSGKLKEFRRKVEADE